MSSDSTSPGGRPLLLGLGARDDASRFALPLVVTIERKAQVASYQGPLG
ncbi:hypothetical protein [Streptomyces sp. NPDC050534]